MKKRKFLAPLAVSVAGLLSGVPTQSHASTNATTTVENPSKSVDADGSFVLKRTTGKEQVVQDYHDSHMSHDSHASHESHVSGY